MASAKNIDVCGKRIARVLQTPWEHSADYSSCEFYLELADSSLLHLGFEGIEAASSADVESLQLQNVDVSSNLLAFCSSDGHSAVGTVFEKVLVDPYDHIYLQLSNQHFLGVDFEEGQNFIALDNYEEFIRRAQLREFFDFWTRDLVIFENLRAIDLVVTGAVNELQLTQSGELYLMIARLRERRVSDRLALPNKRSGEIWTARFVVPEVGDYRVRVQRMPQDFVADVAIDQAVIAAGRLEICVR